MKVMSVSGPTTMQFMVVSPPVENIFSVSTKRFHRAECCRQRCSLFLFVFTVLRTAVNADFFHSSMAFFADGAQETHKERSGGRVHGGFLACLHRVTCNNELRSLYSPMACFAIGSQVNIHFSQDRVQQRLHPRRERYTMSATSLCTLVSPSLPCPSCRSVGRLEAPVSCQQLESDFWSQS